MPYTKKECDTEKKWLRMSIFRNKDYNFCKQLTENGNKTPSQNMSLVLLNAF